MESIVVITCAIFVLLHQATLANALHTQCHQNYEVIDQVWRSTAYERKAGETSRCDRTFIKNDQWYRFKSIVGNEIPTTKPGYRKCGTDAPIWIDGKHPTIDEGIISVKACANIRRIRPFGCGTHYTLRVVNCGDFYLYRLKRPWQCNLAYCAGSKIPVACSVSGDKLPVCAGIAPKFTIPQANVYPENAEYVKLLCSWDHSADGSLLEFEARWIGDKDDKLRRIRKKFSGTEPRQFFYEHEFAGKGEDEDPDVKNYAFNKMVYCEVRSRYLLKSGQEVGDWSLWKQSRRIYTGITVFPSVFNLDECGNKQKKSILLTLTPELPIRVKPFLVDTDVSKQNEGDRVCLSGSETHDICRITFTENHNQSSPLKILLQASCSQFTAANGFKTQELNLRPLTDSNMFWSSYQFLPIVITVAKSTKKTCKSVTDPHFTSFDGKYFDFQEVGTFLLYENEHIGTRIESRQKSCGSSLSASCNCGIAIKEGQFYKIFDMCQVNANDVKEWWTNPQNLVIRRKCLRDSPINGFITEKTEDGTTTTYKIYLPSGVQVKIERRYWGLSTYITAPSPFDKSKKDPKHRSKGLCGNYNGDPNDDFDGDLARFTNKHRVPDASTIFKYKGDKTLEEIRLENCKQTTICSCEKTKSYCGVEGINKCFPSENGNDHTNIDQGLCGSRNKRDATRDDDIDDDDDEIPQFNPPQLNITRRIPTWPTPNGLTKNKVTEICNNKIRFSNAGESCGNITGVNIDDLVGQCILDIQATDNIEWATDNFAAMQETCKKSIYKNASFYENSTDGELKLNTKFIASLCPNDCSNHGNCSNATCTCDEYYTASDCSISLRDRPYVAGIRKDGLCDVRRRPCRNVGIYGFPFLDSANLTCHVQEFKVIDSPWIPNEAITLYRASLMDFTEVKCFLPESPVNIGVYDEIGITAAGLKIAVSNNGVNASENSMTFISYDSVCQECNVTKGCSFNSDACVISGHCYAQNESHPFNWCLQCLPDLLTTSWLPRRGNQRPYFITSSVFYAFRGKALKVQLRAFDPENRDIRYSFGKNEITGASLTERGLFTWPRVTTNASLFVFNVTDKCGKYSLLNANVIIKECPCKNSGDCVPDEQDLEGKGKFTCLCSSQYTGSLCKEDANECVVSKPCGNGSCVNQQPGFLCSCFSGYTGNLCETEIDECVSNPCFPGVSCTNTIGSFICGSCPLGYSGNGTTCQRMDGKVDECLQNSNICHANANCSYSNGSYTCHCINGYMGDGKNCTDIDECMMNQNICVSNANCTNTLGSYSCQCIPGYSGNGTLNCSDINECKKIPSVCHDNATCVNHEGYYMCRCNNGYSGDGKNCTDVNECEKTPSVCHQNATCVNHEGYYMCSCNNGYSGNGKNCTGIIDKNERRKYVRCSKNEDIICVKRTFAQCKHAAVIYQCPRLCKVCGMKP